jgi:leader peptidase (prepilin peptidase)/N-methyltransferase
MFATLAESTPLFLTAAAVFGLLVGSFLNVVILRLPARLEFEWKSQCRELLELDDSDQPRQPPGLMWDRSRCRSCGHTIRWFENIPLLSWVLLRGKCSACSARISPRYPVIEGLTGALFLLTAWHFGPSAEAAAVFVFTGFLVALAGIDLDHHLLPDNLTLMLLWAGLLLSLEHVFVDPAQSIIGAAVGYISLWSVYHLFRLLTGKEGMGYGDFKLMAAMGAWLGWQLLPLVIFLSSLLGAVVGLAMMALQRHQKGKPIPFGPFIALAGWIAIAWGEPITRHYLKMSGFT